MKMVNTKPEVYSLEISNVIESDGGLYVCVVENAAGKVTVTGRVCVDIGKLVCLFVCLLVCLFVVFVCVFFIV